MKKALKMVGISILSLAVLSVLTIVVAKFFFKDEAVGYLQKLQKKNFVELLREGTYAADTVTVNPVFCMDDERLEEVKSHFRLDTLFDGTEDVYGKALKIQ